MNGDNLSVGHPSNGSKDSKAWVVILTRSSYLPATILLDYSLKRVKSKFQLHVLVTPSLAQSSVQALKEAGCSIIEIEPLKPDFKVSLIATRFEDTWTKLRAFGLQGFEVGT